MANPPAVNGANGVNGAAHKNLVDISIASEPCDFDAVPGLLDDISALGKGLNGNDRKGRLELLEKARDLVRALETPRETMLKHVGAQTAAFFSLSLGNEIKLFNYMAAENGSAKRVEKLATAMGYEVDLLRRILRHLAAMGYVIESGLDEYKPTNFTKAMTIPVIADGYSFYAYACVEPMIYFPQWLKINGNRSPWVVQGNPQMFGHRTDLPFFDWQDANQFIPQFNHHMGGYRLGRPSWMDREVYPVEENMVAGFDQKDSRKGEGPILLVDIGGSYGHDLQEFRRKHPHAPGRLILQDLPRILEKVSGLDESIELFPHDFSGIQPIKGARAYYMHHILHDYTDDRCEEIVMQLKPAMTPGYSKLLINEHIIPPKDANWEATYLDLYMMVLFSSRERTVEDWKNLLETRCGLRICNFYNPENGVEGIIECEVPA